MPRARGYPVKITITEVKEGKCPLGMIPGRSWVIGDNFTPAKMCMTAFNALYPSLRTMRYGGHIPGHNEMMTRVTCPDPTHMVIFQMERLPEDSATGGAPPSTP